MSEMDIIRRADEKDRLWLNNSARGVTKQNVRLIVARRTWRHV